jgi:hypothetical protein
MTGLLSQEVADYLAVRRSLGYRMARPEKLLPQFTSYLEQAGAATVTTEHALAWAVLPGGSQSWHAYRLAVTRGFAAWLRTTDPAAEIPPAGLIPARVLRATPYLYADSEVTALVAAAGSLRYPLRTATYRTLIGLLAVTGIFSWGAKRTCGAFLRFACSVPWLVSAVARQVWWSGVPAAGRDRQRRRAAVLSWAMSSRLAARAAERSSPRSSSGGGGRRPAARGR